VPLALNHGDNICFVGDSITAGSVTAAWYLPMLSTIGTARLGTIYNKAHPGFRLGASGVYGTGLIAHVSEVIATGADVVIIEEGVNETVMAGFPADAATYLSLIQAGLPNARIGWLNILCAGSEKNPDPNDFPIGVWPGIIAFNAAIATACANAGAFYLDVRTAQQAYEFVNNTPAPGIDHGDANTLLTVDGVHPNALGSIVMSSAVMSQCVFTSPCPRLTI
jgi:lysophospholipase L1-like esterase